MNTRSMVLSVFLVNTIAFAVVQASMASPAVSDTEQTVHKKTPCYNLVERTVANTNPEEWLWDIQPAKMIPPQVDVDPVPPNSLFKSLDLAELHDWVSRLPKGSAIYCPIFTGPHIKSSKSLPPSGQVPLKLQSEIDAFSQFCAGHGVNVEEIISSG